MGPAEWFVLRLELVVALFALGGTLKSIYNGWLYRHLFEPLEQIDEIKGNQEDIKDKQDDMEQHQERLTDGIVALGKSHQDSAEFDVETFKEETGRKSGSDDFLRGDDD